MQGLIRLSLHAHKKVPYCILDVDFYSCFLEKFDEISSNSHDVLNHYHLKNK